MDAATKLLAGMAKSVDAYGVVIDGVLNPHVTGISANETASKAVLLLFGPIVMLSMGQCHNQSPADCDCMVKALAQMKPEAKIVPVTIQVRE